MKSKYIHPLKFKNYFSYFFTNLTHTPLGQNIKNLYLFFRRYVLVGRIFRITRLVFIYTQTCAYILFLSTALLFLIPVLILILFVFILKNISLYRQYNNYFEKLFIEKEVVVTFSLSEDSSINRPSAEMTVFINVTNKPFFKRLKCAKKTNDKNYTVTMPYFYSLKRKVLNKKPHNVTYIQGGQE